MGYFTHNVDFILKMTLEGSMKIPVSQMRYWDLWPFKAAQIHKLCQWEKRDPRSTVSPVPQYGWHPWEPARGMRPLMSSLDAASRDTFGATPSP